MTTTPTAPDAPAGVAGTAAHLLSLVRAAVPPMHPGGRPIVAGIVGGSLAGASALRLVGLRRSARFVRRAGIGAAAASALFFRQPTRVPPAETDAIVAPADGIVSLITTAAPPPETGLGGAERTRISIFLSVLDVHVQFTPISGRIARIDYRPGAFLSADLDKASDVNERNSLVIAPAAAPDTPIVVTQIAGLIARRIVCDVSPGQPVAAGDVYGLIRFGSRLDTYLPPGATPEVRLGQRAVGGETILARLPGATGARAAGGGA